MTLKDPLAPEGVITFPTRLEAFLCTRYELAEFAIEAVKAGA